MSQSLIVDSSVIVKWLNQDRELYLEQADRLLQDAQLKKFNLITSQLADFEIGNALLIKKKLNLALAKMCFTVLYRLPIERLPITLERADKSYKIGTKYGMTFYDAAFVQLALEFDCPLVTDNPKHQQKAGEAKIVSLPNYNQ